jgi:hypothetical protein
MKCFLRGGFKYWDTASLPSNRSAPSSMIHFEAAFRADLLVEDRLLIEVKSVERLMPVHSKQLLTYLRLKKQPVGLLINFGNETLKEGFKRIVNDYRSSAPSPSSPRLRVNNSSFGA